LPLCDIRPQYPSIVRQQAVDFAFDVCGLRPNTTAAGPDCSLIEQLTEESMASVVPGFQRGVDLVRLIDGVDGFLHFPEMFRADVVSNAAELSLDADSGWIVWRGLD
jgi:hypothetical protein